MLTNEPFKAEAELKKALQLDPKSGPALMGLAAIQVAGQRMDEAEQTYRQLSLLPEAEYKPLHALFLYKLGKRDAALLELEKLAKDNPEDRSARSRLFLAYETMGKTQAAESLLDAALKKNSKDVDALYERASLALQTGKIQQAEKDVKEVLRVKPDFAQGHLALATVYKAEHLRLSERQELNEALRQNPGLLQARLALARSYTRSNEPRSALDLLNSTPVAQKNLLAIAAERNWALMASGEGKEVRSSLDQLLRSNRFPEFLVQDSVLRLQQGDYTGARLDAEEILKNNPLDLRAARLTADTYLGQKQPAKAEERLKQLVAAQPRSAPLANLLGQWYVKNKNLSEARKAYEAAIADDPKFTPAFLALAQLDYAEKRPDAVRQRLLTLLNISPNDTSALLLLATVAGESGDTAEDIYRYRAVLAIENSNLMALNNLAYALALTDPDEALKYAQQAENSLRTTRRCRIPLVGSITARRFMVPPLPISKRRRPKSQPRDDSSNT